MYSKCVLRKGYTGIQGALFSTPPPLPSPFIQKYIENKEDSFLFIRLLFQDRLWSKRAIGCLAEYEINIPTLFLIYFQN